MFFYPLTVAAIQISHNNTEHPQFYVWMNFTLFYLYENSSIKTYNINLIILRNVRNNIHAENFLHLKM